MDPYKRERQMNTPISRIGLVSLVAVAIAGMAVVVLVVSVSWMGTMRTTNLTKEVDKFVYLRNKGDKSAERLCAALVENYERITDESLKTAVAQALPEAKR